MIQSTAPTAGASAWTVGHVSLGENLNGNLRGISCPTSTLCVAVDFSGGVWTTTNPALGPSSWVPAKIPKAKSLFGISCTSEAFCVLVGSGGLIFTSTNPTGGGGRLDADRAAGRPAAARGQLHRRPLRGERLQRRNLDDDEPGGRRDRLGLPGLARRAKTRSSA